MRLIDADRLMEAIDEIDWYHLNNGEMIHGANSDDHQPWFKSDDIYKAVRRAPTVDAPEWIPVKERLPDSNMRCLVSIYSPKFNDCFVTKAGYLTDLAEWDPDQTEHISCWIVITEDFQYYIMDNVVAWMPFPKPYEEEV